MKKVELHLHLDGSLDVNYANELAGHDVSNLLISKYDSDLAGYLRKFYFADELMSDYNSILEFSYRLAKQLENEEVIYAEIRFCPTSHNKNISVDRVITAIRVGLARVPSVKTNLIFCMRRNYTFEQNLEIIKLAKKYLGNGCCAIDLVGDEASYKTEDFRDLFNIIKKEGIPFTIHAGEAASFESVWAAIRFGAKRIGHGIRSIEDPYTVKALADNNIYLEICPKSNIDTKAVSSIEKHPIRELVDAGVLVTISTDNRTVSNTNLEYEYDLLRSNFNFTDEDILKFNLNAIDAAFIDEEEKEKLRNRLLDK